MRLNTIVAATAIAAVLSAVPATASKQGETATHDADTLRREISTATGRAGALKRQLIRSDPQAARVWDEIRQLRERAHELNEQLDASLAETNAEYAEAIQRKTELIQQYRALLEQQNDTAHD